MSEIKNKYLDFSGLQKYDQLIKGYITNENGILSAAIAALDAKIGTIDVEGSDDKSVAEIITDIYASIATILEKQSDLEAKDEEIEDKIAEEIGKIVGDLTSLEEGVNQMTLVEIANKLKAIDGSISKNTEDIAKVTERVTSIEKTIEDLGAIEGGDNLATIVSKVNDNIVAIEKLNGDENTEGSVKKAAKDAADAAQAASKEYVDGIINDKEVDGETVKGLNSRIEDLEAIDHEHENKEVLDGITAEKVSAWDAADQNAKDYADAAKDAAIAAAATDATTKADAAQAAAIAAAATDATTKADAAQAAAIAAAATDATTKADAAQAAAIAAAATDATTKADAAKDAAIADAAGKYQEKGDYEAAGTAAGLNAAMDERVKILEAIDHEKLAEDASAAAVAAIVAGADSDFDTLKDVADWIGSHKEGAAELQITVSNHTESITTLTGDLSNLEEKVDEDIQNLTDHMSAASITLGEYDGRLNDLEAFVEDHGVIEISDIEGLFSTQA